MTTEIVHLDEERARQLTEQPDRSGTQRRRRAGRPRPRYKASVRVLRPFFDKDHQTAGEAWAAWAGLVISPIRAAGGGATGDEER